MTYVPSRFCTQAVWYNEGTRQAWPATGGKACDMSDIACRRNFDSYSARAIWSVTQFVCSDRTQCIIEKAAVSIEISYFEHIFIIIYSYIITYHYALSYTYHLPIFIIIYFFHVSNILSVFTTIETSLHIFTIYIVFEKCLLQLKFSVGIFCNIVLQTRAMPHVHPTSRSKGIRGTKSTPWYGKLRV